MTDKANIRTLRRLSFIVSFICLSLFSGVLRAQNDPANPDRGVKNGASYALSDIETINTTNGNLMLNIPLLSLPKGRGDVGNSVSLMYSSKLFDTSVEETLDFSGQMALQNFLKKSAEGGWRYVHASYSLDVKGRFETYSPDMCDISEYAYAYRVFMRMPDGSRKEFHPTGYDDILDDGFYNVTPDGATHSPCPPGSQLVPPSELISTTGMVYYAADGSYTKLVVDYVAGASNHGEHNPWTLYMPDGSRITGGFGVATRKYDRNGNYIEGLTDEFGRGITIQTNALPDEDHITMSGYNNLPIVWKVKWKTISVNKPYVTTGSVDGIGRGGWSNQTYVGTFRVVDQIILPPALGSLTYEFDYNSEAGGTGWGELSHIKMPSGAEADYSYTTPVTTDTDHVLLRYPNQKTLEYLAEYGGGTTPVTEIWGYSISRTTSTITGPDGTVTTEYHGDTSYEHDFRGLVFGTASSTGSRTERIWEHQHPPVSNEPVNINPYVKTEFTTVPDAAGNPSLTKIVDYTVDLNGNRTEIREYDWVAYSSTHDAQGNLIIPTGALLKRTTATEYYNSPSTNTNNGYWTSVSPTVRNAVKSTEVRDSSGNPVSRSEMFYDNASTTANLIEVKVWDSTRGLVTNPLTPANSVSTTTVYDVYGNPTLTTDAKGDQTEITYGPVNGISGLYPTQSISAYGTPIARTSTAAYDFHTGLVTTATDVDNNVSVVTEYDALGRPTLVRNGVNTVNTLLESWTQTTYNDAGRYIVVRSDLEATDDKRKVATQFFDQLGRVRLTKTLENAATQSATNETDGIKVETRYQTGNPNSYQLTSNPFRAATASAAGSEPTMGWTRSKSWNTGRKSEVETFSGAALPAPWGANAASTGIVTTDIDADRTLVTDQAGKQRISRTNALGQLKEVWEILGASEPGSESVAFPNTSIAHGFKTAYSYDTLNNLTTVNQGVQTRSFAYNSLSRLLTANNPESGLIQYGYDNTGNLTKKTDARGVQTDYIYDALNRVTNRSYSTPGGTPPNYQASPNVAYTYSTTAPSVGRLTKVESTVSTTEYTAFDILGRVTASRQTTDGVTYGNGTTDSLMTYTYNLSGALIEQQYPSGRKVKNTLDADGSLEMVQSRKNANSGYWAYANNFTYNAAGAVTSMQLGNGTWESTSFNSRLQPTQVALGVTQGATGLLDLDYTYGTANNNGNVLTQTITVPTVGAHNGFSAVQTNTYDSLNRLKDAMEMLTPNGGSAAQSWKQTFLFDRYGNRTFDTDQNRTTTIPTGCPVAVCNPSADPGNNKLVGYQFDSSGNMTLDGEGSSYLYDSENKLTEVRNAQNVSVAQYFYDGNGRRIRKVSDQESTIFVYDADEQLIAEYADPPSQTSQLRYLTQDKLGSPRILTDTDGKVIARRDFMPFGEEIQTSQRTQDLDYKPDATRQKFTGHQRDIETGLDFAQARYYSSRIGRFISADYREDNVGISLPFAELYSPQTLNLFSYGNNNPLVFTDMDGHKARQHREAVPGSRGYTYRLDRNNLNDSPNIHIFDRRGREIGRLAIKGTEADPKYEWSGRVPVDVRRNVIQNIVIAKGIAPRPPLHPNKPTERNRGGGGRGGRGGPRGGTAGAFAAFQFLDLLIEVLFAKHNSDTRGYFETLGGTIIITDFARARQTLVGDMPRNTVYEFEGVGFVLLENGTFFSGRTGCDGCILTADDKGKLYIDRTNCKDCVSE